MDDLSTARQQIGQIGALTRALRDAINAANELTARIARRLNTSAHDLSALYMLNMDGPMGATELANRLGIRTASTTVLIDRLEKQGHVQRIPDPGDRRRITIHARPGSDARGLQAFLPVALAVDEVAGRFTEAEQRVILGYLQQVADVYQRHSAESREPPSTGAARGPA